MTRKISNDYFDKIERVEELLKQHVELTNYAFENAHKTGSTRFDNEITVLQIMLLFSKNHIERNFIRVMIVFMLKHKNNIIIEYASNIQDKVINITREIFMLK